ncbi:alpha/beta fold hydrolase [Agromyces sp. NPDC058126]|uniref:alpha/beta fold hydrolase n=1 Tax=Agromyces sp. NPDC058126 TaxID=3346350 RepID=UPI0036DF3B97
MSAATAIAAGVRLTGSVSPTAGGALAYPLFMRVGPRTPVAPADRATHDSARRSTVRIPGLHRRGVDVVSYEWGTGDETVLLAHGWQSRASVFAPLIRELRSEGFRIVAFDGPANGDSPGRGTYLIDHLDAMEQLQRRHGRFHAVVGHSFGALAALMAAHDGLDAHRVVGIAGAADPRTFIEGFGEMLRLDRPTRDALAARFSAKLFPGGGDPFDRYSAARHPLRPETALLLVHDRGDRRVPYAESERLLAVNPGARLVPTEGLGHNRVLRADVTLDAVVDFLTASDAALAAPAAAGDTVGADAAESELTTRTGRSA